MTSRICANVTAPTVPSRSTHRARLIERKCSTCAQLGYDKPFVESGTNSIWDGAPRRRVVHGTTNNVRKFGFKKPAAETTTAGRTKPASELTGMPESIVTISPAINQIICC